MGHYKTFSSQTGYSVDMVPSQEYHIPNTSSSIRKFNKNVPYYEQSGTVRTYEDQRPMYQHPAPSPQPYQPEITPLEDIEDVYQYQPQPQQPQYQPQQPQYQPQPQQPQYQPQQPSYDELKHFDIRNIISPDEMFRSPSCEDIEEHILNCKQCKRRYKRINNQYITIIVFLCLLILYLVTKLMDRR